MLLTHNFRFGNVEQVIHRILQYAYNTRIYINFLSNSSKSKNYHFKESQCGKMFSFEMVRFYCVYNSINMFNLVYITQNILF